MSDKKELIVILLTGSLHDPLEVPLEDLVTEYPEMNEDEVHE